MKKMMSGYWERCDPTEKLIIDDNYYNDQTMQAITEYSVYVYNKGVKFLCSLWVSLTAKKNPYIHSSFHAILCRSQLKMNSSINDQAISIITKPSKLSLPC